MTSHVDLATIHLDHGAHDTREHGVCLLEAVAWWAGKPHTDNPACVSPVLGAFGRDWNDALDERTRQRLVPYIPRMVGTAGDGADEARAWLLTDWLARVCAPAFLRAAGLTGQAERLEQAPPITGAEPARSLQAELNRTMKAARAARAAARDAARAAAWDAARAAAGAAARDALQPTVTQLQESAFALLDRLCDAGRVPAGHVSA